MKRNKSKKSRKKNGTTDFAKFPIKSLESKAQALIAASKWREAILACKELVKRQPAEGYLDSLAQAYRGRAEALLVKGYVQEALVIVENMREFCGIQRSQAFCVRLFFKARRWSELVEMYRSDLEPEIKQAMETRFAAARLAGEITSADCLPEDSAVETGFENASAALDAYCENRDEDVRTLLRGISFRSPYRDFSLILKALLCLQSDPEQAGKYLGRVAADSPFSALVQGVELASMEPIFFWRQKTSEARRSWAAALKGLSEEQYTRLKRLSCWNAEKQMSSLLASPADFDARLVRHFCEPRLPQIPEQCVAFSNAFDVNARDQLRLNAQFFECHGCFELAACEWQQYADDLAKSLGPIARNSLELAEIYGHMGDLALQDEEWIEDIDASNCFSHWQKSLDFGPRDRETYLKLFSYLEKFGSDGKKESNRLLKEALVYFPDDMQLLNMMVDAASKRLAFKMACKYAIKLLDVDPNNVETRMKLVRAQLGHTHKQIKAGRLTLAQKELDLARGYSSGSVLVEMISASQALIFVRKGLKKSAEEELASGWDNLKNNPADRIALLLECRNLGLASSFKSRMNIWTKTLNKTTPTQDAILRFLAPILKQDDWSDQSGDLIEELHRFFVAGARLPLGQAVFEDLCENMCAWEMYRLLTAYAREGWRQYKRSIFSFYQVVAKTENGDRPLTDKQEQKLDAALQLAEDQEDEEAVARIAMFLTRNSWLKKEHFLEFFKQMASEDGLPFMDPFEKNGIPF